jgi:hypothetical protein
MTFFIFHLSEKKLKSFKEYCCVVVKSQSVNLTVSAFPLIKIAKDVIRVIKNLIK